ncbi:MAG: hypothetical protein LBH04_10150 [Tannerellaceae bacterium]|jgi:hypothetical protein|nr:hypothetical protein [Tannerellaceae bacterium]
MTAISQKIIKVRLWDVLPNFFVRNRLKAKLLPSTTPTHTHTQFFTTVAGSFDFFIIHALTREGRPKYSTEGMDDVCSGIRMLSNMNHFVSLCNKIIHSNYSHHIWIF